MIWRVAVARLRVDGVEISTDDTRLFAGWHEMESGWRWTRGDAAMPAGQEIRVRLDDRHVGAYWKSVDQRVRDCA